MSADGALRKSDRTVRLQGIASNVTLHELKAALQGLVKNSDVQQVCC